ncbi:MAG: hypothetical protein KAJ73_02265 [Zetaproteobacteria bacterium]|nr:hypothetical protein [Zetaproteobacteria bacterium]
MSIDRHRAVSLIDGITERIRNVVIEMTAKKLGHVYNMGYQDCRTEFKHVISATRRLLNSRSTPDMDDAALALLKILKEGEW